MACPATPSGAKMRAETILTRVDAERRLKGTRLTKRSGDCHAYYSSAQQLWVLVWPIDNARVGYRVVESASCPC